MSLHSNLFICLFFIITYFLGSIPFALVVSKLKNIDLRKIGSGNIGATNVYRAMGFKWALLVFLLDGFKGFLPTFLAIQLFPSTPSLHILIGITTVVAHSLTIFAKFKGGKGAATGLGVLLALSPKIFIIIAALAFLIIALTHYVSVGTMICCAIIPLLFYAFSYPTEYLIFVIIICSFVIIRHKSNISRLKQGTENKIY
jgi:glycerol-3-phosphate acyltransferase PlsY